MLHQIISEHFQWLPAAPGNSMQHECDISDWIPMIGPYVCWNVAAYQSQKARQPAQTGASSSSAARANIAARSNRRVARGLAINQFDLDQYQRRRLLIRERAYTSRVV
jgi:hypothetical protein